MTANGYVVKQVRKVKILGYTLQSDMKNNTQINTLISNLNNRLNNIKRISNRTDKKTRNILIKSLVIGKLNYTLPLLINTKKQSTTQIKLNNN